MKRLNLIIGKKQIILACLTLILTIAVYMNYALTPTEDEISQNVMSSSSDDSGQINYGDAAFVSTEGTSDYFAQVRLSRMTSRDEAVETLSMILNGGDLSDEETAVYTNESITLSQLTESESKIENLIKAQGFSDCVVYLNDSTASVVVKSEGLEEAQAAQIKDILLTEVTIPAENIRIFEVK